MLLERHADDVEIVSVRAEAGILVIAFALRYPIEKWGAYTIEIALDGTCKCTKFTQDESDSR